jgi:hypothetical protein
MKRLAAVALAATLPMPAAAEDPLSSRAARARLIGEAASLTRPAADAMSAPILPNPWFIGAHSPDGPPSSGVHSVFASAAACYSKP